MVSVDTRSPRRVRKLRDSTFCWSAVYARRNEPTIALTVDLGASQPKERYRIRAPCLNRNAGRWRAPCRYLRIGNPAPNARRKRKGSGAHDRTFSSGASRSTLGADQGRRSTQHDRAS